MKYSVLVKRIANIRVDGIDAASQVDSIQAADKLEFGEIIAHRRRETSRTNPDGSSLIIRYVEDGDETSYYLVDEEGDEEFNKSQWYGSDGKTALDPWDRCPCCLQPRVASVRDIPAL